MKVTICELNDNEELFERDWKNLVDHVKKEKSELVLLNELPFNQWIASKKGLNDEIKLSSQQKHETWLDRIPELASSIVIYSKPMLKGDKFHNTAFAWSKKDGHQKVHTKYYFPEEPHFWEESCYDREEKHFEVINVRGFNIGVLLCSEIWFTEYARQYAKQDIDLLLCPRATGHSSTEQWIRCGQTLAVISGAFCLSSNRSGLGENNFQWGGNAWISEPINGKLLALTSKEKPFISLEIDLDESKNAKKLTQELSKSKVKPKSAFKR